MSKKSLQLIVLIIYIMLILANPVLCRISRSVKNFGARGNGTTDDTNAIQRCIDYVHNHGGGDVIFPVGTYLVSPRMKLYDGTNWNIDPGGTGNPCPMSCLAVYGDLTLRAKSLNSKSKPTIKLKKRAGRYHSIIAPRWWLSDVWFSNFNMTNLIIDGNKAYNPRIMKNDGNEDPNAMQCGLFYPLNGTNSNSIISGCVFKNFANCQVLNCQNPNFSDWTVTNCIFTGIGGDSQPYLYDHSTIYTGANNCRIINSSFSSAKGAGTKGAITAIELHGQNQYADNNTIDGYCWGVISIPDHGLSDNHQITNNTIQNCISGVSLWPREPALNHTLIDNNTIKINVKNWRSIMGIHTPNVWIPNSANGILINQGWSGGIDNMTISNNKIYYDNTSTNIAEMDWYSAGIMLNNLVSSPENQAFNNLTINSNEIHSPLSNGIWIYGDVNTCNIYDNYVYNPGNSSNVSNNGTAAIRLDGNMMDAVTIPYGTANYFLDDRLVHRMKYGVWTTVIGTTSSSYLQNQVSGLASDGISFYYINGGNGGWILE